MKMLLMLLMVVSLMNVANAGWKKHVDAGSGVTFEWNVNGANIDVKVSAQTTGWIGIGFIPKKEHNSGKKMQGANILIGHVKGGVAHIEDHYGKSPIKHKPDSRKNLTGSITNIGGSEAGGVTTLTFTYPLKGKHKKKDTDILTNDKMVILAAVGNDDSVESMHMKRSWFEIQL